MAAIFFANGMPGGEEASPKEQLPEMLGAKRVLAKEKRFEVLDSPSHSQLAAGEPCFADAVNPFVGVHHYKQQVSRPAPHRVCLDAGYLHAHLRIPPIKRWYTSGVPRAVDRERYQSGGWQSVPADGALKDA
jgi:hypothetical protein